MIGKKAEAYMHYCQGTWIDGYVLDCELVDTHAVKLQQTMSDKQKADLKLGMSGRT